MERLFGTLTIGTIVSIDDNEKRVTLATFRMIPREECEERVSLFCMANPQYRRGMLFATWTMQDRICITPEMRNPYASV
jgi:hypothetical protein